MRPSPSCSDDCAQRFLRADEVPAASAWACSLLHRWEDGGLVWRFLVQWLMIGSRSSGGAQWPYHRTLRARC